MNERSWPKPTLALSTTTAARHGGCMDWLTLKSQLVEVTRLEKDALHIYFAVLLQLGVAMLTRRTLAQALPWLAVLAAELANEYYDLHVEVWPDRWLQYSETAHDVVNTMLLPTLLLLLARVRPELFGAPRQEAFAARQSSDDPEGEPAS